MKDQAFDPIQLLVALLTFDSFHYIVFFRASNLSLICMTQLCYANVIIRILRVDGTIC